MDKYAPQYCPQCGTALESLEAENRLRLYCPACDQLIYRNPKPCAGTIVVEEDQLLLVKRARPPRKGTWSVPAGFLEYNERPIVAAARELEEETGLTAEKQDLELFNTRFVTTTRIHAEPTLTPPQSGDYDSPPFSMTKREHISTLKNARISTPDRGRNRKASVHSDKSTSQKYGK